MRRLLLGAWCVVGVAPLAAGQGGLGGGGPAGSLSEDYTEALPVETQLVVGSLKLEETDMAIAADQAQELVPLWQAYRSLVTSETSAQQEREALLTQIEERMRARRVGG